MKRVYVFAVLFITVVLIMTACGRKTTPARGTESVGPGSSANGTVTKPAPVKKVKTPVPKVIAVSDAGASKTFDGRLYYDLEGHRYWKNYKDGKYYLYNKSMNNDPDFKKPL